MFPTSDAVPAHPTGEPSNAKFKAMEQQLAAEVELAPVETDSCVNDVICAPTIEQAQLLLAACPDFFTAVALFQVNHFWARTVAREDSSYKSATTLIAKEAKLHYEPPMELADGRTWRSECEMLFKARGTFVSSFGGLPCPTPALEPFAISVGCRFRPPGAASSEAAKEMVLPLHQRLRLIQTSHGCSLQEARRILWSGEQSSGADPWAKSAAASVSSDKENRAQGTAAEPSTESSSSSTTSNSQADESKAAVADGGGGEVDGEKQPHVVGGGTTDAGAGLIALRGGSAIICAPGAGIRAFDFGHAWGADSRQSEVYEAAVAPLVCDVLNGRSACVLAYGQTGSGKTFSMSGPSLKLSSEQQSAAGLIPRAVKALIDACDSRASLGIRSKVSIACIEIFGDLVTDLLHGSGGGGGGGGAAAGGGGGAAAAGGVAGAGDAGLQEGDPGGAAAADAAGAVAAHGGHSGVGGFWQGVSAAATAAGYADEVVDSYGHALDLLEIADKAKRRAATSMNERSSRAHSLIMLTLTQEAGSATGEGEGKVRSTLCLCDLGGSEKVKKSNVTGERLMEAIHINQGLLALKNCISALNQRQSYVPYQDSKLTYLLKRSLAGGAKTYVLLAARPEAEHAVETLQALRFGEACAQVEVGADKAAGAGRAVGLALESLDEQIAALEATIREKERFETRVVKIKDERAGLAVEGEDGEKYFSGLTDFATYEKKISVIVGAEKERQQLEKLIAQRRGLTGLER